MAKWYDRTHGVIAAVPKEQRTIYDTPVIVIPEGDWRRLVELVDDLMPLRICEGPCDCCVRDKEIKAIIEKVGAANG